MRISKVRKKPWKTRVGIQMVDYNQEVYEVKKDAFVQTFTPFAEFVYKFTKKQSLKTELSYMMTERNRRLFGKDDPVKKQDLGDWFWFLSEYSIAPKWSFSVADMYNFPTKVHYPTFFVFLYTKSYKIFFKLCQTTGRYCVYGRCLSLWNLHLVE